MSNGLDSIVETPQTFSKRVMPVAAMALLAMMVVAMLAVASPAQAATTFEVNSTGDQADADTTDDVCDADPAAAGNQCTLRAAIGQANATAGDDVIDIGVTGTVQLTGPLPNLSSNMEIKGPGADQFTVRRDTGATTASSALRSAAWSPSPGSPSPTGIALSSSAAASSTTEAP